MCKGLIDLSAVCLRIPKEVIRQKILRQMIIHQLEIMLCELVNFRKFYNVSNKRLTTKWFHFLCSEELFEEKVKRYRKNMFTDLSQPELYLLDPLVLIFAKLGCLQYYRLVPFFHQSFQVSWKELFWIFFLFIHIAVELAIHLVHGKGNGFKLFVELALSILVWEMPGFRSWSLILIESESHDKIIFINLN